MSSQNNYSEQIAKYLDGELSPAEVTAFEKALAQDPALKEEMAFYEMANDAIVSNKLLDIEETVKASGKEHATKVKRKKGVKKALIGTLALLTLGTVVVMTTSEDEQPSVKSQEPTTVEKQGVKKEQSKETPQKQQASEEQESEKANAIEKPDAKAAVEETAPVSTKETKTTENKEETAEDAATKADTEKLEAKGICDGIEITAQYSAASTCAGKAEGSVTINKVSGGTAPYSYILSDGRENTSGKFTGLTKGKYSVYVADANACGTLVEGINVTSTNCKIDLYFDPAAGKRTEFPAYGKAGVLTVFDKRGNEQLRKVLEPNETYRWNGEGNQRQLMPGYYLFTITYEDSSIKNGSLTILP